MSDLSPATPLLFLREEELRQGFEMLYFAYRDSSADAEKFLERLDIGPTHYRAIVFISRQDKITFGELLDILRITKQSLGRLVQQLVARGLITQHQGPIDRRQRILSLTEAGHGLERQIWNLQRGRIAKAYRDCGPQAIESFRKVLLGLISKPDDKARFDRKSPVVSAR